MSQRILFCLFFFHSDSSILIVVDISYDNDRIGDDFYSSVVDVVTASYKLNTLRLGKCHLSPRSLEQIASAVVKNKRLTEGRYICLTCSHSSFVNGDALNDKQFCLFTFLIALF
jgi:hypothetical protein